MVVERVTRTAPIADSEIGAFELIESRRLFEGEVAALAATQVQPEHIVELEKLLKAMGDPDQEKAERADRDFHLLVANITGNGALIGNLSGTGAVKTLSTSLSPIPPAKVQVTSTNGGSDTEDVVLVP